jgi:sugar O-acyltransferase (sialic acid O-acetyltransferase NeuD family)
MNSFLARGESLILVGVESDFAPDVLDSVARIGAEVKGTVALAEGDWDYSGIDPFQSDNFPDEFLQEPYFVTRNHPGLRKQKVLQAQVLGFHNMVSIVDPTAVLSKLIKIGKGVFVNAGAVIAAQASIGEGVFINRLAGIGHHVVLGDYVTVGPGASIASKVKIGAGTLIGAGVAIAPSVSIGSNCVIAIGSAVHKDVASNVMVAGNPCRVVETGISGYKGISV